MSRRQISDGLLREYQNFADLLSTLSPPAWSSQTRCSKWQVRDVAAHVVAQASDTVSGQVGTRSPDEQAAALRHQPPDQLAVQLHELRASVAALAGQLTDEMWRNPSPIPHLTVGDGLHALLHDTYVHGDDIREAVGVAADRGPGLLETVDFLLAELSRDALASAHPDIARLVALPAESLTEHTGIDAHDFILVATGRRDAHAYGLPPEVNIFRDLSSITDRGR
jgi:uncharacterized protein (TIGR03083 family)